MQPIQMVDLQSQYKQLKKEIGCTGDRHALKVVLLSRDRKSKLLKPT